MADILSQTIARRSLGGGTTVIPENIPTVAIVGVGGGQRITLEESITNGGLLDALTKENVKQVNRVALGASGPADYIRNSDYRLVNDSIDWSIAPQIPAPSISSVELSSAAIGTAWTTGTWYYAVTAVDADGRESMPSASQSITDPAAKLITVSWAAVPRAVKYKVYRKASYDFSIAGQASLIAVVDKYTLSVNDNNSAGSADLVDYPAISYSHLGTVELQSVASYPTTPVVTPFKVGTYTYAVTSVDGSSRETVAFATQAVTLAEGDITASVRLTFKSSTNRATIINVYRRYGSGPWAKIANLTGQAMPSAAPFDDVNNPAGVVTAVPPTATTSNLGGGVQSALVNSTDFNANFVAGSILYEVTALDREGTPNETPSKGTTAHTVLAADVSKQRIISWPVVPGCGGYRIYRTVGGVRVRIFTTRATDIVLFVDTNDTGSSANPPVINNTRKKPGQNELYYVTYDYAQFEPNIPRRFAQMTAVRAYHGDGSLLTNAAAQVIDPTQGAGAASVILVHAASSSVADHQAAAATLNDVKCEFTVVMKTDRIMFQTGKNLAEFNSSDEEKKERYYVYAPAPGLPVEDMSGGDSITQLIQSAGGSNRVVIPVIEPGRYFINRYENVPGSDEYAVDGAYSYNKELTDADQAQLFAAAFAAQKAALPDSATTQTGRTMNGWNFGPDGTARFSTMDKKNVVLAGGSLVEEVANAPVVNRAITASMATVEDQEWSVITAEDEIRAGVRAIGERVIRGRKITNTLLDASQRSTNDYLKTLIGRQIITTFEPAVAQQPAENKRKVRVMFRYLPMYSAIWVDFDYGFLV